MSNTAGTLLLHTERVNRTLGHGIGSDRMPLDSTIFADSGADLAGDLYRFGLSEYGRCMGKVYVDTDDGVKHVGYVFEKREPYSDDDETYLAETWISIERVVEPARPTIVASVALS